MIGDFEIIQEDFENILLYSQAYPFDLDTFNLLKQWEQAKAPFIQAFGGRTIWRSERPIKINLSEDLKLQKFSEFLDELNTDNKDLHDFIVKNKDGFFDNRVVVPFPNYNIKAGSKLLKSFKQFEEDRHILRWIQDTASRYIQEDKVEGFLYLSVDPRDFLTLSENNANWTSCHSLDGDYRAGNLNYLVDDTTIIAYIASNKMEHLKCIPKDMKWNNKKWRMLVHLNLESPCIYYSRQYPFEHEGLLNSVDRVIKDKFFSEQEFTEPKQVGFSIIKMPNGKEVQLPSNYMVIGEIICDTYDFINDKDNLGYTDLINSHSYKPIISLLIKDYYQLLDCDTAKEYFHKILDITIGKKALCPCCGDEYISTEDSFLCDTCIAENDADEEFYCHCCGCGCHIYDDDDAVIINGDIYCEKCKEEMKGIEFYEEDD